MLYFLFAARAEGFAVFGHRWDGGRQGKIYLPTDVNEVIVEFPCSVNFFHVSYVLNFILTRG